MIMMMGDDDCLFYLKKIIRACVYKKFVKTIMVMMKIRRS